MQSIKRRWAELRVRLPHFDAWIIWPLERIGLREKALLARRPHRSFRRTRRRDYVRRLELPGYWSFTLQVANHLRVHKKVFLYLALTYAILSAVLIGIASQQSFTELSGVLTKSNFFSGGWGNIGQASLLFLATLTGGINNPNVTGAQSSLSIILILLVWLTTVWLVRAQLAGRHPKLRDGLYQAGAPIVALFVILLYASLQLIPAAIGFFMATAVISYGDQAGVLGMLVWIVIVLLEVLSLYLLTSTFIAFVIVTLPGMYPWQAIRAAGDLVIGRRLRILYRMLWAMLGLAVVWTIIMVPVIVVAVWLGALWPWFSNVPLVPFMILVLSTLSLVWLSSYIYLLYRRIVEDDSAPAL